MEDAENPEKSRQKNQNFIIMLHRNYSVNPVMPLLMSFTPKTNIQEIAVDEGFVYDDHLQITEYNMRTVGTKCLRVTSTNKGPGKGYATDKKNEIDDSKTVK